MAIYSGTWKDEAGVAFDPGSFSLQQQTTPDEPTLYLYWDEARYNWIIAHQLGGDPADYFSQQSYMQGFQWPTGTWTGQTKLIISPIPSIILEGNIGPDVRDTYYHTGTHNGFPFWLGYMYPYYIYYSAAWTAWLISDALNDEPSDAWYRAPNPLGAYSPQGMISGNPTASYFMYPALIVTGDGNPDPSGPYWMYGYLNNHPFYMHHDYTFYIWWDPVPFAYQITDTLGDTTNGNWLCWQGYLGRYDPVDIYTGNINVHLLHTGDVTVGGNPAPDLTGTYGYAGTHDGLPYYSIPGATGKSWGVCRLRIFGRRGGSGIHANWYPAGPGWNAGYYRQSPWQHRCRLNFGLHMRQYVWQPPKDYIYVTGDLAPVITGAYGPVDPDNGTDHWYTQPTDFHLWYVDGLDVWYLADTYPEIPGGEDAHWAHDGPDPYGDYDPYFGAAGIATVRPSYLAIRVDTHHETLRVTGDPVPDVTATYLPVDPYPEEGHWFDVVSGFHIWWSNPISKWVIADTWPVPPIDGIDDFWQRDFPPYGAYEPIGAAAGNPVVAYVNFNGGFYYVDEFNDAGHYYKPHKQAHIWSSVAEDSYIMASTFPDDPGVLDDWWKSDTGFLIATYDGQHPEFGKADVDWIE